MACPCALGCLSVRRVGNGRGAPSGLVALRSGITPSGPGYPNWGWNLGQLCVSQAPSLLCYGLLKPVTVVCEGLPADPLAVTIPAPECSGEAEVKTIYTKMGCARFSLGGPGG